MVKCVPTGDELYDSFLGGAPSPDLTEGIGRNLEAVISDAASDLWSQGDRLAVNGTLFRNHIRDRIERTNAPFPTPAYVNIDRAYLCGEELEASYASGNWQLGAAIAMVSGQDQDSADLDSLRNDRMTLNAALAGQPRPAAGCAQDAGRRARRSAARIARAMGCMTSLPPGSGNRAWRRAPTSAWASIT
ncbi:TonB-dependent receptor [Paracoccus hibiscisoli]|uniref:TonB-dependent receptor n=1 Tax=Paracoccus hibiscisoli TaxID=2023261 RepID=A0A4U0QMU4_9RHOB|nr:TonB-dependent receptor [Paracoccus hibiscisoli]